MIWGLRDFRILTFDVSSGKTTVVKDFARDPVIGPLIKSEADLYRVTTKDEGESSLDPTILGLGVAGIARKTTPGSVTCSVGIGRKTECSVSSKSSPKTGTWTGLACRHWATG